MKLIYLPSPFSSCDWQLRASSADLHKAASHAALVTTHAEMDRDNIAAQLVMLRSQCSGERDVRPASQSSEAGQIHKQQNKNISGQLPGYPWYTASACVVKQPNKSTALEVCGWVFYMLLIHFLAVFNNCKADVGFCKPCALPLRACNLMLLILPAHRPDNNFTFFYIQQHPLQFIMCCY